VTGRGVAPGEPAARSNRPTMLALDLWCEARSLPRIWQGQPGRPKGSFSRRNYLQALAAYMEERASARPHDGRSAPREEQAEASCPI